MTDAHAGNSMCARARADSFAQHSSFSLLIFARISVAIVFPAFYCFAAAYIRERAFIEFSSWI